MSEDYGTCNRDYWDQQFPGIFKPIPKSHQSLAQPTPRKARPALRKAQLAGDVLVIPFPLPPKELSPNGRSHWARKAEIVKAVRSAMKMLVANAVPSDWLGCRVRLDVTRWADKRMDNDNAWGCLKAHRDGIADGLMTTDAQFELGDIQQHTGVKSDGRREVELQITKLPPGDARIVGLVSGK